jgi:hypothetical protein
LYSILFCTTIFGSAHTIAHVAKHDYATAQNSPAAYKFGIFPGKHGQHLN